MMFIAFLFAVVCLKDIKYEEDVETTSAQTNKLTVKEIFLTTLKYYPKMIPLLGVIILDGINLGIQTSSILHLVPADTTNHDTLAGILVIVYGVGSLLGSYAGAKLCDKYRLRNVAIGGVLLYGISCIGIFFAAIAVWYPFTVFVSFLYGIQYCYIVGC